MKEISQNQINAETKVGFKPLAIDSKISTLPLSELSDRDFEMLAYLLVNFEIEESIYKNSTKISLMEGVSDRGRDCVLYQNQTVNGLIQCKKYSSRLSRPQVAKELLKFLLFSIMDNSILPTPDEFEYQLFLSNDLTEPAVSLFNSFQVEIEKEQLAGNIKKYIEELVEEYESFSNYKDNLPLSEVSDLLKRIKVSYCNGLKLSARVNKSPHLASMFFNVKSIVDLEGADNLIRSALNDYGLKLLTDDDLKNLQARIGSVSQDHRVSLGYVDFYGFSNDFFKHIQGEGFVKLVTQVSQINQMLSKFQIDYIMSKSNDYILDKITNQLLFKRKIHPFSVGIAAPYLFERLSMKILAGSLPEQLLKEQYPVFKMSKKELIEQISETLFSSSERVLKKDYSELVGSPEDVSFKIKIFAKMHEGVTKVEELKTIFARDIMLIQPVLDEIEVLVGNNLSKDKTVIIKDASFFDNKQEMDRLVETLGKIE